MPLSSRSPQIGDNISLSRFVDIAQGAPKELPEPDPYGGDVFMGAYGSGLRESPMIQAISGISRSFIPADPDWEHPWETLNEAYYPIAPQLARSESKEEWYRLISTYNLRQNDRAHMADEGIGGYAAYMAGAMSDPIVLSAAIATAPYAVVGAGSYAGAAARLGGVTMAEVTAAEAILQMSDPFRTFEDSAISILASGVVGASLGLGARAVAKAFEPNALKTEINAQLRAQVMESRYTVAPDDVPSYQTTVEINGVRQTYTGPLDDIPSTVRQQAAKAKEPKDVWKTTKDEEGNITYELDEEATKVAREAVDDDLEATIEIDGEEIHIKGQSEEELSQAAKEAVEDFKAFRESEQFVRDPNVSPGVGADATMRTTVKEETPIFTPTRAHEEVVQSPLTRTLRNGVSATASRLMDVLVRHNFLKPTHYSGKGPLLHVGHGTLQDEVEFAHKTILRTMADMSTDARVKLKERGIKMKDSEIAMEAGRAARRGDVHEIPEIQKISAEFRRFMKEWGERANKVGLLTDDALKNVDAYFPRVYNLDKIVRNWNNWIDVIGVHFAKKYPDLDPDDLVDIAESIYEKLSGTQLHRPFAQNVNWKPKQKSRTQKSGHLKSRRLDLTDIELEDFLIDDIRVVGARYLKGVGPDVIIREIFGKNGVEVFEGVPLPREWMDLIDEEFGVAINYARKNNPKKVKKIQDTRRQVIQDLTFTIAEITGHNSPNLNSIRGLSLDFARSKGMQKWLGGVRGYTSVAALGQLVLAALPDLANAVLYNGLRSVIKTIPIITMPKKFSPAARQYMRVMNVGLDRLDSARMLKLADLPEWGTGAAWGDPMESFANKMKGSLSGHNVARVGFKWIGANLWNSSVKTVDGFGSQDRFLRDLMRWDKLGKTEKAMYGRLGVGDSDAARFLGNYNKQKVKTEKGIRYADLDSWDTNSSAQFQRIIFRETEQQVVMPQAWERPISVNNEIGGFITQFKGFLQSHEVQHLSNAGQRLFKGDRRAFEFIMTAAALGFMNHYIKTLMRNDFDTDKTAREIEKMTTSDVIFKMVDRGALAGMGPDFMMQLDSMGDSRFSQMIGMSEPKYTPSKTLALDQRVPGLGWLSKGTRTAGAMMGEKPFTAKDLHTLRGMLPLQNLFYLSWLFDLGEEEVAEAFDMPETARQNKSKDLGD